jgi:hypothetical protein
MVVTQPSFLKTEPTNDVVSPTTSSLPEKWNLSLNPLEEFKIIPGYSFKPGLNPNTHEASLYISSLNPQALIPFSLTLEDAQAELSGGPELVAACVLWGFFQLKTELNFSPSLLVHRVTMDADRITAQISEPPAVDMFEVNAKIKGFTPDKLRMSLSGPLIAELIKRRQVLA